MCNGMLVSVDEAHRAILRRDGRGRATKQSSRVADMIYTYARRTYLAPLNVPPPSLFGRYRYRPAEKKETPEENQKEAVVTVVLNGGDAVRHA